MNQLTQSDIKLLLTRWGSWSRGGGTIVVGSATVIRGSSTNLAIINQAEVDNSYVVVRA